jgi:hypothetical protein
MGEGDEGAGVGGGKRPAALVARLRGKRVALAIVLLVSVAFIVSSATQIVVAVFGLGGSTLPSGSLPGSAEHTCATGIRALAQTLDPPGGRVSPPATSAASAEETPATSRPGLSPEWDQAGAIESACARSHGGLDAWAALQRLRVAEAQSSRLSPDDLSSGRRDVAAHLPAELR